MKKRLIIGLLGFGTVGGGFLSALLMGARKTLHDSGVDIVVKRILVRDLNKPRLANVDASILTTQADQVLDDSEIEVIVETIGGIVPAKHYITQAIQNGKHVVTANKALIANYGEELRSMAAKRGTQLLYEASVAGAVPIINLVQETLVGDEIYEISGILNGTTNYILSQMLAKRIPFAQALSEAQQAGYAEADPSEDISGMDAANKLAILARLAFNTKVSVNEIPVQGIQRISLTDLLSAKILGYTVKLLAVAKRSPSGILNLYVRPELLPHNHQLSQINGATNAVLVKSRFAGELMFSGPGAGALPTGSSILADVIRCAWGKNCGYSTLASLGTAWSYRPTGSNNYFVRILCGNYSNHKKVFTSLEQWKIGYKVLLINSLQGESHMVLELEQQSNNEIKNVVRALESIHPRIRVDNYLPIRDGKCLDDETNIQSGFSQPETGEGGYGR